MYFTKKGMIKKSEWSEYDNQRKDSFLAVKLVEEDEVIAVEEESGEGRFESAFSAMMRTKGN